MANKRLFIIGIVLLISIGLIAILTRQGTRRKEDLISMKSGQNQYKGVSQQEEKQLEKENVANTEAPMSNEISGGSKIELQEPIMITDGVKHSIPLEEILSGGPPKDGIPSIDNPKFVSVSEADKWLKDEEPGVAFSQGNTHRFYPYQILVWHEIVNDRVSGERILVTYCPLCLTGYIFDPLVKGERVEFGTSGKLWKSNLVMYDRETDSLWSQILGEAIVGEMTGKKLTVLPSDQVRYGSWKRLHPTGEVLSRDTGAFRFYGSNPYGDYFSATSLALSLAKPTDTRLPNDAFVYGIVINGNAKAYRVDAVKQKGFIEDTFENMNIVLQYDKELDVVRMFKKVEGKLERINPFSAFWFSWAAAYPNTALYQ